MRKPAILVIDDDPEIGQALTAMLGELGHEVEYCSEGAEGLEREVTKADPDKPQTWPTLGEKFRQAFLNRWGQPTTTPPPTA